MSELGKWEPGPAHGSLIKHLIVEAIKEAKRRNPDCQPVIRISDDDFAALEEYIVSRATRMGDFMLTADGLKKLRGCPFEIEPTWIKGWAVAAEELAQRCLECRVEGGGHKMDCSRRPERGIRMSVKAPKGFTGKL